MCLKSCMTWRVDSTDFTLLFASSALQTYDCSFEDGLCGWTQGAEDGLDWTSGSGPTDTPNTGPAGDHTTGKGAFNKSDSAFVKTVGQHRMFPNFEPQVFLTRKIPHQEKVSAVESLISDSLMCHLTVTKRETEHFFLAVTGNSFMFSKGF